jgi:hypothetical protein
MTNESMILVGGVGKLSAVGSGGETRTRKRRFLRARSPIKDGRPIWTGSFLWCVCSAYNSQRCSCSIGTNKFLTGMVSDLSIKFCALRISAAILPLSLDTDESTMMAWIFYGL